MNDIKNVLIAWLCSSTSIFAVIGTQTLLTVVSAIILPMLFFTVGKTVDVLLQIYFKNRDDKRRKESEKL